MMKDYYINAFVKNLPRDIFEMLVPYSHNVIFSESGEK